MWDVGCCPGAFLVQDGGIFPCVVGVCVCRESGMSGSLVRDASFLFCCLFLQSLLVLRFLRFHIVCVWWICCWGTGM